MNEFLKLKYSQVRFLFLLKSIMAIAMRHSSVILLMAILCRASSVFLLQTIFCLFSPPFFSSFCVMLVSGLSLRSSNNHGKKLAI